jgi:peptide/nickel transport system ATP-binding protein/oligopeptide transport system ATP-binding protein
VEALRLHRDIPRQAAWETAGQWLEKFRIPDAAERLHAYPFQLSGGMQQRVMIAMALMLEPELIIADEPTTALDVTIQAQVFGLIREMRQASTAILLITHDMGVVWEMCDRVLVMYAARIVEAGSREEIFEKPAHPYTRGLLHSIPRLTDKPERLAAIGGMVPSPLRYPAGCRFNDRCPHVFDRCRREAPGLLEVADGHQAACFLAKKLVRASL